MTQTVLKDLLNRWPAPVRERARPMPGASPVRAGASHVLYWTHSALRANENPALDAALCCARLLNLPLLVYQGLDQRHPYASDRLHAFILEGARELQQALAARQITHLLHVTRPGHTQPALLALARDAALVITDDLPVAPMTGWIASLTARCGCPVLRVDTACVVPMALTRAPFARANPFARATLAMRQARLTRPWDEQPDPERAYQPASLPFEPVRLDDLDLSDLIGQCDIDHGVAPVPHTRGGMRAAQARWRAFRDDALARYHQRRNDPLQEDGASRMSAYLHFGMIAPTQVAREAAERGGPGAEKYLDELLKWRELMYHFCAHAPHHDTLEALPTWARETLEAHREDRREAVYDLDTLARARTGHPLWDAAQRSLLMHGELHNNVRMSWGKALVGWRPTPQAALDALLELNHRYALDGRDPASYGSLLWCLGLFDGPSGRDEPIAGEVPTRDIDAHAARLKVSAYARLTARPLVGPTPRVAVLGAGMAGLSAARVLADHGLRVTLLDKGATPGGRMSTRRSHDGPRYDHGAPSFSATHPVFARHVAAWAEIGIVAPWRGAQAVIEAPGRWRIEAPTPMPYVGAPHMQSLPLALAESCGADALLMGVRVVSARREGDALWLDDADGQTHGPFDALIVTCPAPQAAPLLAALSPQLTNLAQRAAMTPRWATMLSLRAPAPLPFVAASLHDHPVLAWAALADHKASFGAALDWTLHAREDWTRDHLEADRQTIARMMVAAFREATGLAELAPWSAHAHRWRYACTTHALPALCALDDAQRVAIAGDWCGGGGVQGAFLSGRAAAGALLRSVLSEGALRPARQQMLL